jgi:NTP pyrophosphatase (non-canonical NTP hydrolase)
VSKSITQLAEEMAAVNKANGWWDRYDATETDPDGRVDHMVAKLGLITTEVAEAIEEVRDYGVNAVESFANSVAGVGHKPVGLTSEIADVIIRAIDFCSMVGITDLAEVIEAKVAYNATRGVLHGGKHV